MAGSREMGITILEMAITNILEWYGHPWGEDMIRDCAELMHAEYHWLQLAELKHFVVKAKKGDFNVKRQRRLEDVEGQYLGTEEYDGKIYGKLNPPKLMQWMEEYAGESIATRGAMRIENLKLKPVAELPAADVKYVEPEKVTEALRGFVSQFVVKQGGKTAEQKAEDEKIYRQEKIKQRQRDMTLRNKAKKEDRDA